MMKLCESNQIYDRFGMKRPNNIPSKKSRIPRIMHINFMIGSNQVSWKHNKEIIERKRDYLNLCFNS